MTCPRPLTLLSLILLLASCAQTPPAPWLGGRGYLTGMVGATSYDDGLEFTRRDPDDPSRKVETDLTTMPVIGFAMQKPVRTLERFQFGIEGGSTVGWRRDSSRYRAANGVVVVKIENRITLVDLFIGPFISTWFNEKVRAYAGAGPLIMFGDMWFETEDGDETDSAFGTGGYARAGVDFRMGRNTLVGLSVRTLSAELDFDDFGDVDVEGAQIMLAVTTNF